MLSTTSNSAIHTRPEELDISLMKLYNIAASLPFTKINYMVNINIGNIINLLDRNFWLEHMYSSNKAFVAVSPEINLHI